MAEIPEIDLKNIPRHVAIIMDGNGRWARERNMLRVMGHKAGAESVRTVIGVARELGIRHLTLYAFSTENWNRPALEVQALMGLLKSFLLDGLNSLKENRIRLCCLGAIAEMPADVQEILARAMRETTVAAGDSPSLILNLALNYGSRGEIVAAVRILAARCLRGEITPHEITEEMVGNLLYTTGQPDPDLIIRTGGESRLSNFLLWQASYSEIYITDTRWPDFRRENLVAAIADFQSRERRFGKTGEQIRQGT